MHFGLALLGLGTLEEFGILAGNKLTIDAGRGRIFTVPNVLTLFRIALVYPFVRLIAEGHYSAAMAVFFGAGFTDFVDGFIARRFKQQSSLGRLLDPLADKALITASYIIMAVVHPGLPSIPVWVAVAVIGRDALILIGSLIIYLIVGFKEFEPSFISKTNTMVELALIFVFLLIHGLLHQIEFLPRLLPACYLITLGTVLASGIDYAVLGVKIVRQGRTPEQGEIQSSQH